MTNQDIFKRDGSTFGGNPVVCAGGVEVLNQNITMDEIDRGLDILHECLSGFGGGDEA